MLSIHVNNTIYPRVALIKAVHRLLSDYYIFIEVNENDYIINWESKESHIDAGRFEHEFKNELMAQVIRYEVFQQTKTVRELILARAFASSMYSTRSEENTQSEAEQTYDIDAVLSEWSSNENG